MSKSKAKFNKKAFAIAMISLFAAFIVISSVFLGLYLAKEPPLDEGMRSIQYVMANTIADATDLNELDFSTSTHIIYAFIYVDKDTLLPHVSEADRENLSRLSAHLRSNYPNVKFMLSIASGGGNREGFCEATRTQERRDAFVKELAKIDEEFGFDGFDVDWEYPGFKYGNITYCNHCGDDHAALMETMRKQFEDKKILSAAVSGSVVLLHHLKNMRLAKVLDFANIMCYDLGEKNHAAFSAVGSAMFNAYLVGYHKRQLNLGLPFYGRYNDENGEVVYYDYDVYKALEKEGKLKIVSRNDYSYAMIDGHRLSLDSDEQLFKKARYAVERGYGGVFCWHMGCNLDGSLMREIYKILQGND